MRIIILTILFKWSFGLMFQVVRGWDINFCDKFLVGYLVIYFFIDTFALRNFSVPGEVAQLVRAQDS